MSAQNQPGMGKKGMNTDRLKLEIRRASVPFLMLVVLFVVGFLNATNIVRNLAGKKFWKDYAEYKVAFDNPEGVIPGRHELRIAGVKSGYIKDAKLEGDRAVLTLAIDKKDAPLYKDAHVQIRPNTPLEDMYVDITSRGTAKAGELRQKKDILPIVDPKTGARNTESMVETGRILNALDDNTRPRLATLFNQLSKGMEDRGASLREAFNQLGPFLLNAKRFTDVLSERRTHVQGLIHNLGLTTEVLGNRNKQVAGLLRSASDLTKQLVNDDAQVAGTLNNLPPAVNSLRTGLASLQRAEDHLDPALRSLLPTASALPSGLQALQEFSKDADPAVVALRPAIRALRPLAKDLRPTARTLRRTTPKLRDQGKVLDQFTDKLAQPRCRQQVGDLLHWLPSMNKFNVGGVYGPAQARADVTAGFTAVGELTFSPTLFQESSCWTGETAQRTYWNPGRLAPFTGAVAK